jgi:hypothetical protein
MQYDLRASILSCHYEHFLYTLHQPVTNLVVIALFPDSKPNNQ